MCCTILINLALNLLLLLNFGILDGRDGRITTVLSVDFIDYAIFSASVCHKFCQTFFLLGFEGSMCNAYLLLQA